MEPVTGGPDVAGHRCSCNCRCTPWVRILRVLRELGLTAAAWMLAATAATALVGVFLLVILLTTAPDLVG